jgi:hypothetical protein
MWRDILLANRDPVLRALALRRRAATACARPSPAGDGAALARELHARARDGAAAGLDAAPTRAANEGR